MLIGYPLGQTSRRGGGQPGHRRQRLTGRIGAVAVEPHQEILARQLRRCDPDQQLTRPEPAVTLLDRTDRCIQQLDRIQPVQQLSDRDHPRIAGHRRIRVADTNTPLGTLPRTLCAAYPVHQMGAFLRHRDNPS